MVLEKTLESPLDCKEIQAVHLKEISPGISLEGMMLKLKFQYFGHLMGRVDSLEGLMLKLKLQYFGHSERDQPWDFFGGNDAEAEAPVLWPPHAKS